MGLLPCPTFHRRLMMGCNCGNRKKIVAPDKQEDRKRKLAKMHLNKVKAHRLRKMAK